MVKVSVIIPVYNEKYLSECLQCLINQTLNDIEIICIDDGSTDKSADILETFSENDDRFKIISTQNLGVGHARNIGLDNSSGEYIYFIDAGDFIELNTLEELYNTSFEKNLDVLIFQMINYDDEKDEYYTTDYYDMSDLKEFVKEDVFNYEDLGDLIFEICVCPVNKFYKRSLIKDFFIRFPEGVIFEDNIFFWKMLFNAKRMGFVPKYYYVRQRHDSSVMKTPDIKFTDTLLIHNMIFDIFKEYGLFDKYKAILFNKKILMVYSRLTQVAKKDKKLFFEKMKKDFFNMVDEYGYEDIFSCLNEENRVIFNGVLNCQTVGEYILIMDNFKFESRNNRLISNNKKLKKEYGLLEKENNSLLSSTSWKITKPLRFVKNYSITEHFLNRSNSYVFYKKGYEDLTRNNTKLKKEVNREKNKNKQLLEDKKQLFRDNNYSQLQSHVYHNELTDLKGNIDYIFDKTSDFNDLEEIGLFVKLFKYKCTLDNLNRNPHQLYRDDMARIDIKNFGICSNTVEVLENSDSNPIQSFPVWFADKKGKGLMVKSYSGDLNLKLKIINDGKLKISLLSLNLKDENGKKIDRFVEYTSFVINGVDYLDNPALYSHKRPFTVEIPVQNLDILDINFKWTTYDRTNPIIDDNGKEIYQEIRNDLIASEPPAGLLEKMPIDLYGFYIRILNYETYNEYVNFINALKTNYDYVNKKEMQVEIDNFKEYGLNREKRDESIIVSLTSYPERMRDIHFCIYSLLKQNFKPDKVILWLAREQFPNKEDDIPDEVLKLKENGLTIKWCKDIKSYKKLIPILKEYPDDFIVTADDDIYYHEDWLEKMWKVHLENPNTIISSRARIISKDSCNGLVGYDKWKLSDGFCKSSYLNFATGAGGIMYFPHSLSDKVFDEDIFMKLCPTGDDIWFWAMTVLNKTKITGIDAPYNFLTYVNVAREVNVINNYTLWYLNKAGKNDVQIKGILKEFPEILEIINND